ncbi:LacI family DNA-binding transcriptional regulator [Leuconostoc mesenteroides]|uniref:LacI family DNA-binding transcriptional regulator n=1 Tax=Leuconostoc mesenteroides TaxID=1245 RepID=UPI00235F14CD|nr:LacI family DNA-binding transcriptional regulator [Leuconostoc mesenteroides]
MVTIQDIANKTGVAISTVSRALGDSQKISLRTKERIREAARDMGYTPNFAARNLTQTESNTVGVVFQPQSEGNTDNDFAMQILFGINAQLIARRYLLTTATGSNWSEVFNAVKRMVEAGQVRRFILLYTVENDPIAELLRENHARVVVTGEPEVATNILYVDNDNRELGFREAQEEGDVLSLPLEFTQQKQALQKYFEQHQTVDGIVASDDNLVIWHVIKHKLIFPVILNCRQLHLTVLNMPAWEGKTFILLMSYQGLLAVKQSDCYLMTSNRHLRKLKLAASLFRIVYQK